ncbi:MAG: hypothetical protein KGJ47_11065 [Acidobacteriota bacterium]|nr:hypothetical protein [Acidobacteriota bacterium]
MRDHAKRAVAGAAALVLTLVATTSLVAVPVWAAAPAHPACRARQIRVSAGPTLTNATYTVATSTGARPVFADEAVPVYFYNRGGTCHLLMGAPAVSAVRDATRVASLRTLPLRDLSIPTTAQNTRRRLVDHHQRLEALVMVARPVGPSFAGCDPATATGILVQGYAGPIGTFHFVARPLRDVCFDTGVGRNVVNVGVFWLATS